MPIPQERLEVGAKYLHLVPFALNSLSPNSNFRSVDGSYLDKAEATDFVCDHWKLRASYRCIGYEYAQEYPYKLTIRDTPDPNGQTEFDKILDGKVQLMLFAWENEQRNGWAEYVILNLAYLNTYKGIPESKLIKAGGMMQCFDLKLFDPRFIIGRCNGQG